MLRVCGGGRSGCCTESHDQGNGAAAATVAAAAQEVATFAPQLRMAAWLVLLTLGWALQKGVCRLGWPSDCASDTFVFSRAGENWAPGMLAELDGVRQLLTYGFFTGWLNGLWQPLRFQYLLGISHPRLGCYSGDSATHESNSVLWGGSHAIGQSASSRLAHTTGRPLLLSPAVHDSAGSGWRKLRIAWFPVCFLVTIPAFSGITQLQAFQRSLSSNASAYGGHGYALYLVAVCALALGCVVLGVGHVLFAWRHAGGRKQFWLGYALPRMATVGFFAMYIALLVPSVTKGADDRGGWHLHHWWIAWLASLFFSFNHFLSAIPFAISTGIFVQGCAAYVRIAPNSCGVSIPCCVLVVPPPPVCQGCG
jgi:hypothetical protein